MIRMLKVLMIAQMFLCVGLTFAAVREPVLLKGTIRDSSGNALAGVRVQLKKYSHIKATTEQNGSFTLSGNTKISNGLPATGFVALERMFIRANALFFSTTRRYANLQIGLYNSRGSRISLHTFTNTTTGHYSMPLQAASLARGVYYCRVIADDAIAAIPLCIVGSGAVLGTMNQSTTVHRGIAIAAASSIVDTLLIAKQGYRSRYLKLTEYSKEGLACSLRVSNPWKPSGSLTRDKGMVKIMAKGYNFEMGSLDSLYDIPAPIEYPVHTVSFTYDFWMDTTEVTQGDYDTIMKVAYTAYEEPDWLEKFKVGKRHPTYSMSWGDAALYANAMSKKEKLDTVYKYTGMDSPPGRQTVLAGVTIDMSKNGYRLPTEAEWEYAARGGTTTDFYWGKNISNYPTSKADTTEIGTYAVWRVNSGALEETDPDWGAHPVATKIRNPYGLYDMAGGVSEWINDYFQFAPYTVEPVTDPMIEGSGDDHSLRGGNWGNDSRHLRCSNRAFLGPQYEYFYKGFRLVKKAQ
ncbi:MAG: SUMF1/EgtB/PvdO family nonheme iron enzyme [Chitinivibrionales bacterium]|nr:SUMF1/EgtB/PvdO family nonheme iron enzyme [Chitinivibrionales bacterium]